MSTTKTTRLREREPQLIVRDAAYALTALADDAVTNVRTLADEAGAAPRGRPGPGQGAAQTAPERIKTLPEDAQSTFEDRRSPGRGPAQGAA